MDANDNLVNAFDAYLARQRRTARTRLKYGRCVKEFTAWVGDRPFGALRRPELERYFDEWWTAFEQTYGREPAADTHRGHLTALKTFFAYVEQSELLRDEDGLLVPNRFAALPTPKRHEHELDVLTAKEDRALLDYVGSPVEVILVWLLRQTGIRVGEASALALADVDLIQPELRIRSSKTPAGRRVVPLNPELIPRLESWFEHIGKTGLSDSEPLLITRNGTPMQPAYMWRVVKRVAFKAGVRPVTCTCGTSTVQFHDPSCARGRNGENMSAISCHTLRRTYGSDLLNRKMPIEGVSKLLGHKSVKVTQEYYAQLRDDTVHEWYAEAIGRSLAA